MSLAPSAVSSYNSKRFASNCVYYKTGAGGVWPDAERFASDAIEVKRCAQCEPRIAAVAGARLVDEAVLTLAYSGYFPVTLSRLYTSIRKCQIRHRQRDDIDH